jgi:hypothetical protein
MGHGGRRPGAGRPRGRRNRIQTALVEAVTAGGAMTPLQYLLAVMNDQTADVRRRDCAAIAAAPFIHARLAPRAEPATDAALAETEAEWAFLHQ